MNENNAHAFREAELYKIPLGHLLNEPFSWFIFLSWVCLIYSCYFNGGYWWAAVDNETEINATICFFPCYFNPLMLAIYGFRFFLRINNPHGPIWQVAFFNFFPLTSTKL